MDGAFRQPPTEAPAPLDGEAATLFDALPLPKLLFTPDLVIVAANAAHCAMTGVPSEEVAGRFMFDVFPETHAEGEESTQAVLRASVERAFETGAPDAVPLRRHDLVRADGTIEQRYWEITHAPMRRADGSAMILQSSRDVTAEVLKSDLTAAKQRAASLGAGLSFFEYDPETDKFTRAADVDEIFGFAPGEAGPLAAPFFARMHPDDLPGVQATIEAALRQPQHTPVEIDYRVALPDGGARWVIVRGEIIRDPETQAPTLVGILLDVSDIKRNEAALRETLDHRDLLLAEVNHRVKNSLALVTAVLRMEANNAKGGEGYERLRAAASRIQSIAAVHAELYQGPDVRRVGLRDFITSLCEELASVGGAAERDISVRASIEDVSVPTDRAVSLALILNELVTNSLKHAFGDSGSEGGGAIEVTLERTEAGFRLTIGDDGAGIEQAADGEARQGLGGKLVPLLARQLEATVTHPEAGRGFRTVIDVPL